MYYLKAIIFKKNSSDNIIREYDKYIIDLNYNLSMLPLTDKLVSEIDDIEFWTKEMSANTIIAFVDAEYFTGIGGTIIHIYKNKILIKEIYDSGNSIYDDTAVYSMLKYFKIDNNEHPAVIDLGLLKHNKTEDWLDGTFFERFLQRIFPKRKP